MASDPRSEQAEESALLLRLATEDPERAERLATEARGSRSPSRFRRCGVDCAAGARPGGPGAPPDTRGARLLASGGQGGRTRALDPNLAAEARLSLAGALVLAGDDEEAMSVLDAAQAGGPTALAVEPHRAAVLTKFGRYEEALKAYQVVIPGPPPPPRPDAGGHAPSTTVACCTSTRAASPWPRPTWPGPSTSCWRLAT